MSNPDSRVISNAIRQAQLEAQHKDVTKPVPQTGSTGESIRAVKGFDQISDEMLAERATFNLKDHMAKKSTALVSPNIDLTTMTADELRGLAQAAVTQLARKEGE